MLEKMTGIGLNYYRLFTGNVEEVLKESVKIYFLKVWLTLCHDAQWPGETEATQNLSGLFPTNSLATRDTWENPGTFFLFPPCFTVYKGAIRITGQEGEKRDSFTSVSPARRTVKQGLD